MVVVLALLLSAAFGAGDQYLGSLIGSGTSGPPAGRRHQPALRAVARPAVRRRSDAARRAPGRIARARVHVRALVGYGLMTLSPFENAHLTAATMRGFLVSERNVLIGGIVTGPLFGWFGQQWRTRRAILGALVTAAALCLEPLARRAAVTRSRFRASGSPRSPPDSSSPRSSSCAAPPGQA